MDDATVTLVSGEVYSWGDAPHQFRHIVDKKRAMRLVRNAETVTVREQTLGEIQVKKGSILPALAEVDDEFEIACVFNGLDLTVIGAVYLEEDDTYLHEDDEDE